MKRKADLYDAIISVENLTKADKLAHKGKLRQYGVIKHIENEQENINALQSLKKESSLTYSPEVNFWHDICYIQYINVNLIICQ